MYTGRDKLLIEGLEAAKKANYNGIFLLPTGSGKGRLMIEIAKLLKPKSILYVCNTQLLRDKMFLDELAKWDALYLRNIIDFQCYQTTYKWVNKHYDLLLADEFDAGLSPEYIKTFTNNKFNYKILVSATLDEAKKRKALKIAPIILEKKPPELIENKILNNVKFYFINYDLSLKENNQYLLYNERFKELLNRYQDKKTKEQLELLQIQRKHFLSSLDTNVEVVKWLLNSLNKKNEKVLIFCGLSKQADRLCKYSYHSNNEDKNYLEAFDKGEINTIAVVNKADRGLNINGVKNIIHESIGKSKTRLTQRIGRGMRLSVNDTLNTFFLIPYFKDKWGNKKPTIVLDWVLQSTVDMDLKNSTTINYKK